MNFLKRIFFIIALLSFQNFSFSQSDKFMEAMDLISKSPSKAKAMFLETLTTDAPFHGTYHFLGFLYAEEGKMDSAIYYYEKSIELNEDNVNKTKEMTYSRLIQTYSKMLKFEKALTRGWEGLLEMPESKSIKRSIEDACLWAYYINQQKLNPDYLKSNELKEEYVVRSISQEYLILRNIRVNGEMLNFTAQSLVYEDKQAFDVLSTETSQSQKKYDVKFKLDWDLNKEFGGKTMNTKEVAANYSLPASEIIGAMLIEDRKLDLTTAIKEVLKKKTEK